MITGTTAEQGPSVGIVYATITLTNPGPWPRQANASLNNTNIRDHAFSACSGL